MPVWAPITAGRVPADLFEWLSSRDSLTARCRKFNGDSYRFVKLTDQQQTITEEDAGYLQITVGARVTVREILHQGKAIEVYGRSVLTDSVLKYLSDLKEKQPLGELLFASDSPFVRSEIEVARLARNHALFQSASVSLKPAEYWARRSIFKVKNTEAKLAVYEVFRQRP
ncbi:MAG: hypothetical protein COV52_07790 [Gammaproteobacteria bacterium CG11_big_fil_rev_8_21_14_0_20_46_22]|nr:MAG: hypothetical protein COW05_03870 [Gammaproteobacteria bacterium CG12_big_fil_rev_8_21_14_0_65_46_12]PIR10659.1 MAG: hypothetical protein COV52_07790 [Gammaproteobacteria bacterium CG11_big_fil_rev_8_21_14_0_20_46_22]